MFNCCVETVLYLSSLRCIGPTYNETNLNIFLSPQNKIKYKIKSFVTMLSLHESVPMLSHCEFAGAMGNSRVNLETLGYTRERY